MANNIDQRIVDMKFDNSQFEKGVNQTVKTIDKLNEKLKFKDAGKGFKEVENSANKMKFGGLKGAVDSIAERFSSMGIVGMTVLQNLTNSAVNAGKRIASAFTIDPIKTGFQEYETQINAVQTILANTSSKGTTLNQVNAALDELNRYADMTIYNFTEMTRNIGTFTAAGVDLDTSVSAIKGIANLAAVSGSNSQQASTAMYQLSQALAAGTVKLQDWNSVVNAGMGGQVFQDALKETARVHGIKIDDMIKKEGSFRETLQEGWLTSAILTETLAKFTGDLSEEQLRSIGYTDEQITAIMEMGKTANDAATKVKTFTQLMDTLKEAAQSGWTQSWEIIVGDFEEAKEFLTEVSDTFSDMINASSDARNQILQGWKDLGGRDVLINSFRNLFQAVMSWVTPFKEAMSEIIPPITAQKLYDITQSFAVFTRNLILGGESVDKVKRTFKGFFAIIDIGIQAVKAITKIIGDLISKFFGLEEVDEGFGGLFDRILDVTAAIGDYLVRLDELIKSNQLVEKVTNKVSNAFDKIGNIVTKISSTIANAISSIVSGGVGSAISLGDKITPILSSIFGKIKSFITSALSHVSFESVFAGFMAAVSGGILVNIYKFVKKLTGMFEDVGDKASLMDTVKEALSGLTDTLSELQTAVKAHSLLTIAVAVGILAASLVALSSIDADKLFVALSGMAGIFTELIGSLYLIQSMDFAKDSFSLFKMGGLLIGLAISVNILASAVQKLSALNLRELAKGLSAVGVVLLELSGFLKLISLFKVDTKGLGGLIFLAAALNLIAIAVGKLGSLDLKTLVKGLGSVLILLAGLAGFSFLTNGAKGMVSVGVGMIAVAGAMLILYKAVAALGSLSLKELGKGLGAIGVSLTMIGSAMRWLMPKNMITNGAAMVLISGSIVILAQALTILGEMPLKSIGKGLIALGGSLLIIAGAMRLMQKAIPGAIALNLITAALMGLTPVLLTLGSMSLESIAKSLIALFGTFMVLGGSAVLLEPVVPTLLGLAAAVALLGVGLGAAGIGIAALSIGLTTLAASGGVAAAAFTSMIESLLSLIPILFRKIGEGIIEFLNVIAESGSAIINAVTTIITSVLTAIQTTVPQIGVTIQMIIQTVCTVIMNAAPWVAQALIAVIQNLCTVIISAAPWMAQAFSAIIESFLQVVIEQTPNIINAGWNLILQFVQSIIDNAYIMGKAATEAISRFIQGVASNLSHVIQAAIDLAISFVNGVANGIRNNQGTFKEAIRNLISAVGEVIAGMFQDLVNFGKNIIDGLVQGIKNFGHMIGDALGGIVNGAVDGIKNLLGIHSPSRVFRKIGEYCILGMTNGIEAMGKYSKKVANAVVTKTVDVFSNAATLISEAMDTDYDFNPTITPVIDMTNVDKAMGNMQTMFDAQHGFNIEPTVRLSKSALYRENQNGSQIGTSQESTVINNFDMTQNNYSPKALSRIDIYRNTRNQFSRLKGVVNAS